MFHQSGTSHQPTEHRELIEDGIEILSNCELDMIAQRGVSLLRAMLESGRINNRKSTFGQIHQPPLLPVGSLRGKGLDIADVICTFYKHDRASFPPRSDSILRRASTARTSENNNWSSLLDYQPGIMQGADFVGSLGLDSVEGLDEILNLATNYLN